MDLSGSTELGDGVDPEILRSILIRYFDLMRRCVVRHGGTVEKYTGDAVMAVFGVPVVHEDDALRAVQAAQDMRDALPELDAELARGGMGSVSARIGINTGEVVATVDPGATQALVAGDTVNVAARLEQPAAPHEILLGAGTYRLVSNAVATEEVGPISVKGKSRPLPVRRVLAVHPHTPPVARRFDVALCGRRRELRHLDTVLDGVAAGAGVVGRCILCTGLRKGEALDGARRR